MIGVSVPRVDGRDKVTGRARFAGDYKVSGMTYGKVLRSPLASGRIISLDVSRAMELPGVLAVLTAEDLRDVDPFFGHAVRDRPIVAIDQVRYIGEPVAAVAALSPLLAEEAVSLIEAKYEETPAVFDPEQALLPGAPPVHGRRYVEGGFHGLQEGLGSKGDGNLCSLHVESQGDADRALAESDLVTKRTYRFPSIYHYALEPHTALAEWKSGGVEITACAQHPFIVRQEIAQMFGLPLNKVRVRTPYIGGGFGSKSYTKIEPIAVALARKAGRPVMLELSVEEAFMTTRRHSAIIHLETGMDSNGTLRACRCTITLNTGAYADNGPRVARWAAQEVLGAYRFEHYHVESRAVYTHTAPAGSFRAIGGPQALWACESQMDIMARQVRMERLQFRLHNMPERGEVFRQGRKPLDADLKSGLQRTARLAGWQDGADGRRYAWGLACFVGEAGAAPVSVALIRMQSDGSLLLFVGTSELGQGALTVFAQIAAAELGVPIAAVRVLASDSNSVPFDRSTGASRSTTVMGSAVREAARDLADQMRSIAVMLGLPSEPVPAGIARQQQYAELVSRYFGMPGGELVGRGYSGPNSALHSLSTSPVFWEIGYGVAKIAVDPETGVIHLAAYTAGAEAGRAINPRSVAGQELGAFTMGMGNTLFEEIVEEDGEIRNANLIDYRVPFFTDMPEHYQSVLVEHEDGPGPFGARGIGEGSLSPVGPAIGNALAELIGTRAENLPLVPEKVWRLIKGSAFSPR